MELGFFVGCLCNHDFTCDTFTPFRRLLIHLDLLTGGFNVFSVVSNVPALVLAHSWLDRERKIRAKNREKSAKLSIYSAKSSD